MHKHAALSGQSANSRLPYSATLVGKFQAGVYVLGIGLHLGHAASIVKPAHLAPLLVSYAPDDTRVRD